jgi:hypothetical protein
MRSGEKRRRTRKRMKKREAQHDLYVCGVVNVRNFNELAFIIYHVLTQTSFFKP